MKLFAVYLGGRAPKSNIELHDVVFATGIKIEDTYQQLLSKWFGLPNKMHIDSFMELNVVDGYKVTLSNTPSETDKKLFFINLGAYRPGEFTEHHAITFLVDEKAVNVKDRALKQLLTGYEQVHKDDLYDVDDCIEINQVNQLYVHLEPTEEIKKLVPNNGYHVLPRSIVKEFMNK
ncbi:DUF1543 domain-containing protein [Ascidiimonas sp. W6]|uniref:DUF1543 domain-containing protein n=1 Tax=Ascidiimonas meishanensis TaxID=3128903 RepID=UPI0030EDABC4